MARVIAVANQKGGVAKTTTVHSLGTALAERGRRVLLVDLDPQACLTWSTGIDSELLERSLHDLLLGRVARPADVVVKRGDLFLLPATIDLAGAEVHLLTRTGREYAVARALAPLLEAYDVVLLDCPPSLGILTINGLTAAHEVLVPLQCETLSHRGVGQLLETVDDVRSYTNPGLEVLGVVATLYDGRTRLAHEVLDAVRGRYGLTVLEPPVPKSVRVAEAPGRGRSVLEHAPRSTAAQAYRALAQRVDELGDPLAARPAEAS
ncbi:MAG: ParA family protein [Acidimicrobiales bacterium]|nr:ParA family protein [Acidimicrobiales bacterium]